jgi:hypothetical protein
LGAEEIMSEANLWGRVRKALKSLDPVRVENPVEPGTPDVNLSSGAWIELKYTRKAPKRKDTIVKLDHEYQQNQKTWAERRIHAGGVVFVFVKIGPEYFLFDGLTAIKYLGKVTLEKLREVAIKVWKRKLIDSELREILTCEVPFC